ncbi:MAG: hypothetical protein IJU20_04440 [Clostridia bacterium]|nr:hypothetical protein [Clostridia bacterium]
MKKRIWIVWLILLALLVSLAMPVSAAKVTDADMLALEPQMLTALRHGTVFLTGQKLPDGLATSGLSAMTVSGGGKYLFFAYTSEGTPAVYRMNLDTFAVTASWQGKVTDLCADGQGRLYAVTEDALVVLDFSDMREITRVSCSGLCAVAAGDGMVWVATDKTISRYFLDSGSLVPDTKFGQNGEMEVYGSGAKSPDGDYIRVKEIADLAVCGGFAYLAAEAAGGLGNGAVFLVDKEGTGLLGCASCPSSSALTLCSDYVISAGREGSLTLTDKDTMETVGEVPTPEMSREVLAAGSAEGTLYFAMADDGLDADRIFYASVTYSGHSRMQQALDSLDRLTFDSCDEITQWNRVQCAQKAEADEVHQVEGAGCVTTKIVSGNYVMASVRSDLSGVAPLDATGYTTLSYAVWLSDHPQKDLFKSGFVHEVTSAATCDKEETQVVTKEFSPGWNYFSMTINPKATRLDHVDFIRMYNVGIAEYLEVAELTVRFDAIYVTKGAEGLSLEDDGKDRAPGADPECARTKTGMVLTDAVAPVQPGPPQPTTEETRAQAQDSSAVVPVENEPKESGKGCGGLLGTGAAMSVLLAAAGYAVCSKKRK